MSNGASLIVNEARLRQAAEDIESAIKSMDGALDDAENSARPLISTWQGTARTAYDARQQKWTQAANDLTTMLRDVKKAVIETADRFRATEDGNTALFE
jgi:early secretory antigenic target protein ESAT-6